MSKAQRRYCIFGCDSLVTYGVPFHRFPNPDSRPDMFDAWIAAVGSNVTERDRTKVYKNKRICDHHFDTTFKTTGGHLTRSAIPTLNLNRGVQQTITTFVDTDHSYCHPGRESARPTIDITNPPGPSRSGPSSAVGSTCLTSSEKCHARTPLVELDQGKTFEYLEKKAETQCARKARKTENEVRRLRQKVKTLKLRINKLKNKSANSVAIVFSHLPNNPVIVIKRH